MFHLFKKKGLDNNIYSPVDGVCIALDDVKDEMFSSRMLGEGVAFILEAEEVCAPCDGRIAMIASTKHAFGILGDNGIELLVHIGLDTVNLSGEGFEVLVSTDTYVKKGTPIIRINRGFMDEKNVDLTTPMIITNECGFNPNSFPIQDKVIHGKTIILCKNP